MAKARKPFVSRKKRKEMDQARTRRENFLQTQVQKRQELDQVIPVSDEKREVFLPASLTVGEFAALLGVPVVRVISQLMKSGIMAAITARVDFDTMAIVADELGFEAKQETHQEMQPEVGVKPAEALVVDESRAITRPPVVTIMGHVDHGKTSLLDKIRQSNVAGGEHGGITQHIGAYQAEVTYEGQPRRITFLDTPGHEAFTALRSHGAQVTDIVLLVIAADDGFKPQTIEALNHARAAGVPIVAVVTKVDLPGANVERIKQQLTEHNLIPEEWGGTTIVAPVSSVTGEGIPQLLEYIVLVADLKNYKADPHAAVQGVVIESHQEVGLGPVATLLIQNGTLHVGDTIVMGNTYGKVRIMQDYNGKRIPTAGPSTPVKVSGIQAVPAFGETFAVVKNEKEARELLAKSGGTSTQRNVQDISRAIAEGRANTLNIVLKADAQGSLEALKSSIAKLEAPGVSASVIHSGIGDVALTDIQLAAAANGIVLGFHVGVPSSVKKAAEAQGVTVQTFKIIYDMLNQIEMILQGRVQVEKQRVERGRLKVKKVFRTTKESQIIGGEITQGVALAKAIATITRGDEVIGEGKVTSLQKGPEQMQELEAGQDCGLSLATSHKIQEGDTITFFIEEDVVVMNPGT